MVKPTAELLEQAAGGDNLAWTLLVADERDRLRRMIALRIDRRLNARIDGSDVVQETLMEAANRLKEFLAQDSLPFYLWLRLLACQRLAALHRQHVGAQLRSVKREVSIDQAPLPGATSAALARQLVAPGPSPAESAMRREQRLRVRTALDAMTDLDREILALRHFEQLTAQECGQLLDISEEAAKKRYLRALERLRESFVDPN
jgi:RNA polymerase sigma-70 factor (ECF subfamily)